jgi:hypothetical protein
MPPAPRRVRRATLLALAAALCLLGFRAVNQVSAEPPGADSGVYASCARHLLGGRALYREVWDHKPPGVHVLNCLALAGGGESIVPVRRMEQAFAALRALLVFMLLLEAFGSAALAGVLAAVFVTLFHHPLVFQGGNLTEEYAASFALAGAWLALRSERAAGGRAGRALAALSGAAFAAAALTKEPFAASALPWLAWLALRSGEAWKARAARALWFLGGAAAPLALTVLALASAGALGAWLDTVAYNFRYVGMSPKSPGERLAAGAGFAWRFFALRCWALAVPAALGLLAPLCASFRKRTRALAAVLPALFLLDLLAAAAGGWSYRHYFLQAVPSAALLAGSGAAFLVHLAGSRPELRRVGRLVGAALPGLLAVCALSVDAGTSRPFLRRLGEPFRRPRESRLARLVRERTGPADAVWAPLGPSSLALETGRLSPTRYFYAWPHLFIDTPASSRAEKLAGILAELRARPPALIVLPASQPDPRAALAHLAGGGPADFLAAGYRRLEIDPAATGGFALWAPRGEDAGR